MPDHVSRESQVVLLDLLDRRRATSDASMWQAPVLTVAAQAFLLQVLSDQAIDWWARLVLLLAGLLSILAAVFTLLRGPSREVQFTEAMEVELERLGLPSVLPDHLTPVRPAS